MTVPELDPTWRPCIPTNNSATQQIAINKLKIDLLFSLNEVLKERRALEKRRNCLLQAAALRQLQVLEHIVQCDAAWHKKIAEAQALGQRFEEQCAVLRNRRNALHQQLLAAAERATPTRTSCDTPSIRANYKMQAIQLKKEISDMKRRVFEAKFRLESETKKRNILQSDVKKLRNEAGAKKTHAATVRPQTLALIAHPIQCRLAREHFQRTPLRKRAQALLATSAE